MNLDFRSKLVVFLCTVFLASYVSKDTVFFSLILLLLFYLFVTGYIHYSTKIIISIVFVFALQLLSNGQGFGILIPEMFLFIIIRTLVIILSVIPIIKTPPGELMAVMRKLKVHRNIMLPLLFMMRFLPIIKKEFSDILDSLRIRGLISIKKPLRTLEYLFVPMMFSASKTAEELAASSEVRGISSTGMQTSRRDILIKKVDYLVVITTILLSTLLYYMEGVVSI